MSQHPPSDIYRALVNSGTPGCESVAQHQVYYRWKRAKASMWKRDEDPYVSARTLLSEPRYIDKFNSKLMEVGGFSGIAVYIRETTEALSARIRELAMDSTRRTNGSAAELFGVLAEVDGAGIPLAYCYIQPPRGDVTATPGAKIEILARFLAWLKDAGVNPSFFGTDKDASEIAAVGRVWPSATHQLCCWHAKRAVRKKLDSSEQVSHYAHYHPGEALRLIPSLEVCWGSSLMRRPPGDHRNRRRECPSRDISTIGLGRLESMTNAEKDKVLSLFLRHFNAHSFIPDARGNVWSPGEIHQQSALEMYRWCKGKDFPRLWAYLLTNWYSPAKWKLWARSSNPQEIPVLKTTMVVESHWRKLKQDFLNRFHQPRIDLALWVIISGVVPDPIQQMMTIQEMNHR